MPWMGSALVGCWNVHDPKEVVICSGKHSPRKSRRHKGHKQLTDEAQRAEWVHWNGVNAICRLWKGAIHREGAAKRDKYRAWDVHSVPGIGYAVCHLAHCIAALLGPIPH